MGTLDNLQNYWIMVIIALIMVELAALVAIISYSNDLGMVESDRKIANTSKKIAITIAAMILIGICTFPKLKGNSVNLIDYIYRDEITEDFRVDSEGRVYTTDKQAYKIEHLAYDIYPDIENGFYDNMKYEYKTQIVFGITGIKKEILEIENEPRVYVERVKAEKIEL